MANSGVSLARNGLIDQADRWALFLVHYVSKSKSALQFVGVAPSNTKVIPQCLYPFPYHKVSGRGEQRCLAC